MIAAVMQPTFNPWMGYFDLIDQVDVFVFLDDVQLSKQSWQTRNRIKTQQGELLLSIPLKSNTSLKDRTIHVAQVADHLNWRTKHLKSIQTAYAKAPYFAEVYPVVAAYYQTGSPIVSQFNEGMIRLVSDRIGLSKKFVTSSQLAGIKGEKDERVVQICKAVGTNEYLSPKGSAEYINRKLPGGAFLSNGIMLYYHDYQHPQYPQLYGMFLSHMGILDLLFNVGFADALSWVRSGRKEKVIYKDF